MIDIPPLDELRETRRRLAEQQGENVERYAAMLVQVSRTVPGNYVAQPPLAKLSTNERDAKLLEFMSTASPEGRAGATIRVARSSAFAICRFPVTTSIMPRSGT